MNLGQMTTRILVNARFNTYNGMLDRARYNDAIEMWHRWVMTAYRK